MQLTESMILARAKLSTLDKVRQLNLCGYNLSDVSVLSKLPFVEILALSVNNISSLESFRDCQHLRELYLRRNSITDVRQVYHLQGLPFLRNLWLIENPFCAQLGQNYRPIILSILPHLQILDNEPVTKGDVEQSKYFVMESDDVNYREFSNNETLPSIEYIRDHLPVDNRSNVLSSIFPLVKQLDLSGLEILQSNIGLRISEMNEENR